ncbi:hypothetical protein ACOMHN_006510 [Nucella lapillus]
MWGMDLTMLPKSDEGHNYLVVAVDYLSKYVEAAPLKIKEAPAILTFLTISAADSGFRKLSSLTRAGSSGTNSSKITAT